MAEQNGQIWFKKSTEDRSGEFYFDHKSPKMDPKEHYLCIYKIKTLSDMYNDSMSLETVLNQCAPVSR